MNDTLVEDIVRSIVEDGNVTVRTDFAGVPKQYVFFRLYTDNKQMKVFYNSKTDNLFVESAYLHGSGEKDVDESTLKYYDPQDIFSTEKLIMYQIILSYAYTVLTNEQKDS